MSKSDLLRTAEATERSRREIERAVVRLLDRATVVESSIENAAPVLTIVFPEVESREYEGATVDLPELPNEDVLIEALWQVYGLTDDELAPVSADATPATTQEREAEAAAKGEVYLTVREKIRRAKAGEPVPATTAARKAAPQGAPLASGPQAGTMTLDDVAAMLSRVSGKAHVVKDGAVVVADAAA